MKNYQEVSPKRLEEYNSIVDEVDKRALALMSEEMGMPEDCCVMGAVMCFGNTRSVFSVQNIIWFGAALRILILLGILIENSKICILKKNVVSLQHHLARLPLSALLLREHEPDGAKRF